MGGILSRWRETARSIGAALLEVLAAEAGELGRDLAQSGRALRGGLILFGLAAGLAFWTIGLGLWVAVELLTLSLPAYGAALVVFGAGLLSCLILVWLGRRRLRRAEMPIQVVKRRGREHADWWRQNVLPGLGIEMPVEDQARKRPAGADGADDQDRQFP